MCVTTLPIIFQIFCALLRGWSTTKLQEKPGVGKRWHTLIIHQFNTASVFFVTGRPKNGPLLGPGLAVAVPAGHAGLRHQDRDGVGLHLRRLGSQPQSQLATPRLGRGFAGRRGAHVVQCQLQLVQLQLQPGFCRGGWSRHDGQPQQRDAVDARRGRVYDTDPDVTGRAQPHQHCQFAGTVRVTIAAATAVAPRAQLRPHRLQLRDGCHPPSSRSRSWRRGRGAAAPRLERAHRARLLHLVAGPGGRARRTLNERSGRQQAPEAAAAHDQRRQYDCAPQRASAAAGVKFAGNARQEVRAQQQQVPESGC